MLYILTAKTKEGLVDSCKTPIEPYRTKIYYGLYENDNITEEEAIELIKQRIHGYSMASQKQKDNFVLLTENQYNNLFKGRLKRREEDNNKLN